MPNATNNLRGEQWDACHRCGWQWWESAFRYQKGLKLCPNCVDNLDVERREAQIAQILGQDTNEGTDTRDAGTFFENETEGEF